MVLWYCFWCESWPPHLYTPPPPPPPHPWCCCSAATHIVHLFGEIITWAEGIGLVLWSVDLPSQWPAPYGIENQWKRELAYLAITSQKSGMILQQQYSRSNQYIIQCWLFDGCPNEGAGFNSVSEQLSNGGGLILHGAYQAQNNGYILEVQIYPPDSL